jgi:16S rRNA (uracil1498-N3)-methyltransferase
MHRLFIDPGHLTSARVVLQGESLEKLHRVLRLHSGDIVYLFDGTGCEYRSQIVRLDAREGELAILEKTFPSRESPLTIHLAQALPKADKMTLIVQKATELGVLEIHPFYSARTVSTYDQRQLGTRVRRWQKVAEEAARQSGRTRVPSVCTPVDFEEVLHKTSHDCQKIMLHTSASATSLKTFFQHHQAVTSVFFLVGPEGGFSPEEVALCVRHSFVPLSLGRRILRTETTALAFLTILQYELGDIY